MVVRDEDPRAAVHRGVGDDVPEWKLHSGFIAGVRSYVKTPRLFVEMRDPQAFPSRVQFAEAARKERLRGCNPV
jgi:hypothetical protein